jgi:hypothetical protein
MNKIEVVQRKASFISGLFKSNASDENISSAIIEALLEAYEAGQMHGNAEEPITLPR